MAARQDFAEIENERLELAERLRRAEAARKKVKG